MQTTMSVVDVTTTTTQQKFANGNTMKQQKHTNTKEINFFLPKISGKTNLIKASNYCYQQQQQNP